MHPILFQSGSLTIYTYGVLAAAGFLAGLWYAYRSAPRFGLDRNEIWNLGIYGILIALAASKIWLILSAWDYYAANPRRIFSYETFQSAGVFYGGIIGGILWVILYTHFRRMPLLAVLDLCAAPVALGHGIGRLGCFAAGCCYGKPTPLAWGVTFTNPAAERISGTPLDVSLHPTQLYEAAAEFVNFGLLVWLGRRLGFGRRGFISAADSKKSSGASTLEAPMPRAAGHIIGAYFILYGLERGTIEFFRDDPGRTLMFHDRVSLMQLVSVALILAGAFLWLRARPDATPVPPRPAARAAATRL